ncbi:uncharacterized protein [Procambarus clarkii]|uniref:uncharacterized protein n=1 Tax=Procambarus clarkii TaxID=6728 RepID=UPI001E674E5D|nr:uncharacterized protein LOC123750851 [Procambarus clarkii]
MHPKLLWELCVDTIVQATVRYQRFCRRPREVWLEVQKVWRMVWRMNPPIPLRASVLLHSHLWQGLYPAAENDITRVLLALLGAKCPRICLVRFEMEVDRIIFPEVFSSSGVYSRQDHLQELDISGIDLGFNCKFLVFLLPWCHKLAALKLGVNVTYNILYAAQACPITVLHISQRKNYMPELTENNLMEMLFGIRDKSAMEALDDLEQGRLMNLNPTWPRLEEFSVGRFPVSNEFFLILLIIFPRFRCLSINLQNNLYVINYYYNLLLKFKTLRKLSISTCTTVVNTGFMQVLADVAPILEEVKVAGRCKDMIMILKEILPLNNGFPFLHTLRLYELKHFGPGEPPLEAFMALGPRLKLLEVFGGKSRHIRVKDIVKFLTVLPVLEEVTIGFDFGFRCIQCSNISPADYNIKIDNVKTLRCQSRFLTHKSVRCLLKYFPALQEVVILGKVDDVNKVLAFLKFLPELRAVKVVVMEKMSVADLCEMPKASLDQRPWELHANTASVSPADRRNLINSGWTFLPVTRYDYP